MHNVTIEDLEQLNAEIAAELDSCRELLEAAWAEIAELKKADPIQFGDVEISDDDFGSEKMEINLEAFVEVPVYQRFKEQANAREMTVKQLFRAFVIQLEHEVL